MMFALGWKTLKKCSVWARLKSCDFLVLVFLSFWFRSVSSAWRFPSCNWVGKSVSLDRDCAVAELLTLSLRSSVIFYGVSFENAAHQSSFGVLVGFGTLLFSRTWFAQRLSTPPSIPGSLRRVESLNCPKSLSMRSWEQNPFSKMQLGFETPVICKRKYLDEICSRLCSFCSHNFVLENSKGPCVPSALRDPTSSLLGAQEKTRSLFSQGIQHECFSRTW